MLDLQKASMLKRVSAFILDFIVLIICITGLALLLSAITGYDSHSNKIDELQASIGEEYGVDLNIDSEEYNELNDVDRELFDKAKTAFESNSEVNKEWNIVVNLMMMITSLSILFAYIITEFAVPLFFGNGQTLGKKVFSLGVMRSNHVKISPIALFVRTVLGKFTLETMVAVLVVIMILLGILGIVGTGVLALILILQIVLLVATKNNCVIHDLIADTVVVDLQSQMIFNNEEEVLEKIKKMHEEKIENSVY